MSWRRGTRVLALVSALAGATYPAPSATAATPGAELWHVGVDMSCVSIAAPRGSGSVIIAGDRWVPQWVGVVAALDVGTGATAWADTFGDGAGRRSNISAMVVAPDGSTIYVARTRYGSGARRASIVTAIDVTDGTRIWSTPLFGPPDPAEIAVSPSGAALYMMMGAPASRRGGIDIVTRSLRTSDGSVRWSRRINGGPFDGPGAVEVSPDGSRVLVTGETTTQSLATRGVATLLSARTGRVQWFRRWGRYPFTDAAFAASGKVAYLMTGWGPIRAIRVQEGLGLWRRTLIATSLAVPSLRGVVVAGSTTRGDLLITRLAQRDGAPTWRATLDGPASAGDRAQEVVVAADGNEVIATGYVDNDGPDASATESDTVTLVLDVTTGAIQWSTIYADIAGNDSGDQVASAPDGFSVFTCLHAGESYATGEPATVAAYGST